VQLQAEGQTARLSEYFRGANRGVVYYIGWPPFTVARFLPCGLLPANDLLQDAFRSSPRADRWSPMRSQADKRLMAKKESSSDDSSSKAGELRLGRYRVTRTEAHRAGLGRSSRWSQFRSPTTEIKLGFARRQQSSQLTYNHGLHL